MAAVSLFLAVLLAVSAGHKLLARERLALTTARLVGAPASLGMALLLAAATVEAIAALALVLPPATAMGALLAAALWAGYALALWRRRGEVLDCGCDLVRREKPVTAITILRPVGLALLALAVAALPAQPMTIDAPFAALALLALWFAASELSALPARVRR